MKKRLPKLSRVIPLLLFCFVISCKKQVSEEAPVIIKKEIEGYYEPWKVYVGIKAGKGCEHQLVYSDDTPMAVTTQRAGHPSRA